jgi:hypothetical protein
MKHEYETRVEINSFASLHRVGLNTYLYLLCLCLGLKASFTEAYILLCPFQIKTEDYGENIFPINRQKVKAKVCVCVCVCLCVSACV